MTDPAPTPAPTIVDVRQMYRELDRLRHAQPPPPATVLDGIAGLEGWLSVLYPDVSPPPPEAHA